MPQLPRFRPTSTTTQIGLGLFLAMTVVMTLEAIDSGRIHVSFGDSMVYHHQDGDRRLKVVVRGDVTLRDDESGIEHLAPGSYFEVETRDGRSRRQLQARPSDGGITYTWRVDRRERPFDAEAEAWLQTMLPTVYRTTGLDADLRTARLLAAGGFQAVVEEIEQIPGDGVQRRYVVELIEQGRPRGAQLAALITLAGEEIASDYELRRALTEVPPEHLEPPASDALVTAVATLGSDYELRRLLDNLLTRETLETGRDALVAAAHGIGSDFELASWLVQLADASEGRPFPAGLPELVATLDSDHEHRRALRALVPGHWDDPSFEALLATALQVGSDFELRHLLVTVAEHLPTEQPLPPVFFELAATVQSDYELRRALSTVAERPGLDVASLERLLQAAQSIDSDFELAGLLHTLGRNQQLDASRFAPSIETLLASLQSDHERQRAEAALANP